uniref:N-acyl homoserine lactonase (AHL-lactonase) (Acyl-homoserine lactonase) (EC) n=1 Tax=Ganoderma boninense TaxID=34458 RepID=A0A5K1JVU9_9APHY|nr:N-acyl homoserine lactonase (AHL-lactonase) (Acyl-homoserine lactonase) (EC [Ganoderma boninense]
MPESKDIAFFIDLISNAPNLRRLTLPQVSRLIESHPRLKDSLLRLRKLSRIEFDGGVGTGPALSILKSSGWNLSVLSLGFLEEFSGPHFNVTHRDAPRPWTPLLDALAAFPRLHTLRILSFNTNLPIENVGRPASPTFPSLRELFIRFSSSATLDLVYLMPNLQTLEYKTSNVPREPSRRGPAFSALRSVMFDSSTSLSRCCAEERLGNAYHLRIFLPIRYNGPDTDPEQAERTRLIMTAFRKVSPVFAEIGLMVGGRPMEFWGQIAADVLRLRHLELRVHLTRVDAAHAGWLDNVPGALASLPLVGLRIHLGEMPGVDLQTINERMFDDPIYGPSKAVAMQLYSERMEAIRTLPRRLADAIRSLRVVALSDGQSDLDYDGTPSTMRRPRVGDPRVNVDDYASLNVWLLEPVITLEWWRIVRDGDEIVRMDALTAEQGKQAQRFVEESDLEALDRTVDREWFTFVVRF